MGWTIERDKQAKSSQAKPSQVDQTRPSQAKPSQAWSNSTRQEVIRQEMTRLKRIQSGAARSKVKWQEEGVARWDRTRHDRIGSDRTHCTAHYEGERRSIISYHIISHRSISHGYHRFQVRAKAILIAWHDIEVEGRMEWNRMKNDIRVDCNDLIGRARTLLLFEFVNFIIQRPGQ